MSIAKHFQTVSSLIFFLCVSTFGANAQVGGAKNGCSDMNLPILSEGSCEAEAIKFYAGRYLDAKYSWDFNDDGVFEEEDLDTFVAAYQYNTPGVYDVKLRTTSPNCPEGVFQEIGKRIEVSPKAQFKMEQSCEELGLKSFSGSVETTEWLISDGSRYLTNEVSHVFKGKSGKYEVLLVTHVGGCTDTSTKVFEYETIEANPNFQLENQCVPTKATFTNSGQIVDLYKWYLNDSLISEDAVATFQMKKPGTYGLSVALSNKFGCHDSTQLSKSLFVGPAVKAQIEVEKNEVCLGTEVVVKDISINNTRRQLLWGDDEIDSKGREFSHMYTNSGRYQLLLIAENSKYGCFDTLLFEQEVVVAKLPKANFLVEKKGVCVPQEVEFVNSSSDNYTKSTFLFDSYDTLDISAPLVISKSGRHDFRLILENEIGGCSSEKVVSMEFFQPLSTTIAPSIYQAESDSLELRVNWSSLPNAEYFELYKVEGGAKEVLGITNDTFYSFPLIDSNRTHGFAVKAVDQCAFSSGISATVRGINLDGSFQADSFPTLQWSPFDAWSNELDFYEIEVNTGDGWEYVGESKQPHYVDRDFNKNETLEAQYRVIARHKNGLFSSKSDEWAFEFEPNLFIPTAFTPNYDNINDQYEIKGYGMEQLNVQIFNSFGERVYDYEGQDMSWDGSFKGEMVTSGAYLCVVEAITPSGQAYNFQRTITVIR